MNNNMLSQYVCLFDKLYKLIATYINTYIAINCIEYHDICSANNILQIILILVDKRLLIGVMHEWVETEKLHRYNILL